MPNVDIETVANYCYSGMVLQFNGNFNLAINTLMEKARKVYFKINQPIVFIVRCNAGTQQIHTQKVAQKLHNCSRMQI
jgi:hypothetical protein